MNSGSHNNYEGDSSPARGDLNQHGTNEDLIVSHFKSVSHSATFGNQEPHAEECQFAAP